MGDKEVEEACYANLGTVYLNLGKYAKAAEYQRKALPIAQEIDNKKEEATCYTNLGTLYLFLGKYAKAEEYQR